MVPYIIRAGWRQVPKPLEADGTPPGLGSAQFALIESSTCAWSPEFGTRRTIQKQCSSRRSVSAPADGPTAVGDIRQSADRPVCVPRKCSLSEVFLQEHYNIHSPKGLLGTPFYYPLSPSELLYVALIQQGAESIL